MTPRLCHVCGARVRNRNLRVIVCSTECDVARESGITRERAALMLASGDTDDPFRAYRPPVSYGRVHVPLPPSYYDHHLPCLTDSDL